LVICIKNQKISVGIKGYAIRERQQGRVFAAVHIAASAGANYVCDAGSEASKVACILSAGRRRLLSNRCILNGFLFIYIFRCCYSGRCRFRVNHWGSDRYTAVCFIRYCGWRFRFRVGRRERRKDISVYISLYFTHTWARQQYAHSQAIYNEHIKFASAHCNTPYYKHIISFSKTSTYLL
jgi:hypothetical protein